MGRIYINIIWLICAEVYSVTSTSFQYHVELLPWRGAQAVCQGNGGSLFIPTTASIKQLVTSCPAVTSASIWSGQYVALSAWIEFVGCFTNLNRPKVPSNSLTTTDPLVCQHLCQNNTYFGFYKGDICICFGDDSYILTDNQEANSQECNIRCGRRPEVFCGGQKAVSVYKTATQPIPDKSGYDCSVEDCNCVSAECETIGNATVKVLYAQPCSSSLVAVCSNDAMATGGNTHWTDSLMRCSIQQNRYLMSSDASGDFCKAAATSWTSIFRDTFILNDHVGKELGNVKSCRYINLTSPDPEMREVECSVKMPFLCQFNDSNSGSQVDESCFTTQTSGISSVTSSIVSTLNDQSTIALQTPSPSAQVSNETAAIVTPIVVVVFIIVFIIGFIMWHYRRKNREEKFNNEINSTEMRNGITPQGTLSTTSPEKSKENQTEENIKNAKIPESEEISLDTNLKDVEKGGNVNHDVHTFQTSESESDYIASESESDYIGTNL